MGVAGDLPLQIPTLLDGPETGLSLADSFGFAANSGSEIRFGVLIIEALANKFGL